MKQSIYEPALYALNGQLRIKAFTIERPKPPFIGTNGKEYMMNKFLASAIDYPVQEGSIQEFKIFVGTKLFELKPKLGIKDAIEQSVRIDELADRLEVVGEYGYDETGPIDTRTICLLPEVKEESQFDIFQELFNSIGYGFNQRKYDEYVNNKFTIKRNQ